MHGHLFGTLDDFNSFFKRMTSFDVVGLTLLLGRRVDFLSSGLVAYLISSVYVVVPAEVLDQPAVVRLAGRDYRVTETTSPDVVLYLLHAHE
jgi:hypothetical protein